MANVIFESATAAQAAAFTSTDTLIFNSTNPNQLAATYAAAVGTTAATITLTNGTQTLTFAAASLKVDGTNELFPTATGKAYFGTTGDDNGLIVAPATTANAFLTVNTVDASAGFALAGNDSILVGNKGNHLVDAGAGNDTISFNTVAGTDTGSYVIQGGAGSDTIGSATASALGNLHIYGNLVSSATGDADGNDVIFVGSGTNYVNGNAGDDTITVTQSTTTTLNTGVNRLFGGSGNDIITGGDGIDSINGNVGNDTITGALGNDVLHGGQGNDVIFGDATSASAAGAALTTAGGASILTAATVTTNNNDTLFGDVGDDTLVGGQGYDVLTGGTGADRFVFNYNTSVSDAPLIVNTGALKGYVDAITDFSHADGDKIDLVGVDSTHVANILVATGATFSDAFAAQTYASTILTNSTSSAINHDIVAVQVGSDTYIFSREQDTAHGAADTAIKLTGVTATALVASDFI